MKLSLIPSLIFAALASLAALPAHAVYKCVDEKGVTHYGDTMPPQCDKKPVTEMTQQGSVIKKYDAPLTPEQLKAQAEERERRKEGEKRIAEQKLRDNALLSTYGSEREFDVARDKDLAALDARKKTLLSRNADVDKYLAKMENEMEFYKAGKSKAAAGKTREAPPQLTADLERARKEKTQLATNLASYDREIEQIRARYDADKKRWTELKQLHREGKLDLRDPREIEAAAKKGQQPAAQTKRYNIYLVPAN